MYGIGLKIVYFYFMGKTELGVIKLKINKLFHIIMLINKNSYLINK